MAASNSTEPGNVSTLAGKIAYNFFVLQPLLPFYTHLISSALFPIYAGAHASLSRPSSAEKPEKTRESKKRSKEKTEEDSESDDLEDDEDAPQMEGLSPSDALWFPLAAGSSLVGLYFLIKWLGDASVLNKILNAYFALFSVFAVTRIISDALRVVIDITFPRFYVDAGLLWRVRTSKRKFKAEGVLNDEVPERRSPLPSVFGRVPLPVPFLNLLWALREILTSKLKIKIYARTIGNGATYVGLRGLVGLIVGISAVLYFNFVQKPWYLTNLMGIGFAYEALQFLSPSTFATGTLVLGALFFYDIYFVFCTPMMVAVAQSLDIPIKLVFPRPHDDTTKPRSEAMLGLGDVVLPGIMIGLALRFDHYMYYLRKQKRSLSESEGQDNGESQVIKAPYKKSASSWASHFWSYSWIGYLIPFFTYATQGDLSSFPKPYFRASLIGYVSGLITTIVVMVVYKHAQPALLYLVPGVLTTIWATALLRGEIKEMWNFQDGIEEDALGSPGVDGGPPDSKIDEKRPTGFFSRALQKATSAQDGAKTLEGPDPPTGAIAAAKDGDDTSSEKEGSPSESSKRSKNKPPGHSSRPLREIFSLSIEAPAQLSRPFSKHRRNDSQPDRDDMKQKDTAKAGQRNDCGIGDGEPAGKRVRVN